MRGKEQEKESVMTKEVLKVTLLFAVKLALLMGMSLLIQLWMLQKLVVSVEESHVFSCYLLVFVLTILSFLSLQIGNEKTVDRLGFIFLGRSLLKMLICFVFCIFLLRYKTFHRIAVFFSLVMPYSIALFVEVFEMLKKIRGN